MRINERTDVGPLGQTRKELHLTELGALNDRDDVWFEVDEHELEEVSLASPQIPPAAFCERATTDLGALVEGDRLWLFGTLSAHEALAFEPSRGDLLVQLKWIEQTPVVVLALVDARTAITRRAYLDPVSTGDRSVLLALAREFRATIVLSDEGRVLRHAFQIERPRAANASLILQRTQNAPKPSVEKWLRCISVCRLAPPPLHVRLPPFIPARPAADASEALRRIDELERWSTPARIDFALLAASVPRTSLELSCHRVLLDGLRFGLAMSSELLLRAVRAGFSPGLSALVDELRRRFAKTELDPSCPLSDEEIARNRAALEALTRLYCASTPPGLSCKM